MAVSVLFKIVSRKFELTLAFSQLLSVIQNDGSDPGAVFKTETIFKKKKKFIEVSKYLNSSIKT